jgi:hypothetical protein
MQTKIALVKLLEKFNFDKSHQTLEKMEFSVKNFVLAPKNDELYLKVSRL